MRLKNDVNLVDFLNQVQKCKYDVYMETVEEDKLNLKSVLSQYLFVVLVEQKDVWDHLRRSRSGDLGRLSGNAVRAAER